MGSPVLARPPALVVTMGERAGGRVAGDRRGLEFHLRRLVRDYVAYYHDARLHEALNKETPTLRVVERRPSGTAKVVGMPRVGGLHHRYHWQTAA